MADTGQNETDTPLELPPALEAKFKQFPAPCLFVPPTVDEQILRAARQHLQRQERPRSALFAKWRLALSLSGIAAMFLIAALVISLKLAGPRAGARFAREDLNRDGRVDILDAFSLARTLKNRPTPYNPALDINGDGVVDERDVTSLAARAVQLPKGGRS